MLGERLMTVVAAVMCAALLAAAEPEGERSGAMHLALRSVKSELPQLKSSSLRATLERALRDALAARGQGESLVEPQSTDVDVAIDVHMEWVNNRGGEGRFLFVFKLVAGDKRDRVAFQQRRPMVSLLGAQSMAQAVIARAHAMVEAVYTPPPPEGPLGEVGAKLPPGEAAPTAAPTAAPDGGGPGEAGLDGGAPALAPGEDHVSVNNRVYVPVRAAKPISVDGVLDEEVWSQAPRESRFQSRLSEPHGLPTKEPTEVQVAFDDKNLYVAFRCRYSEPGPRDDSVPESEFWASVDSELVAVVIDPQHDHTNAYSFQTTRSGFRTDVQMAQNAEQLNYEWNGIWDTAVHAEPDEWTAEFMIPWGTIHAPAPDGISTVGINFRRKVPGKESSAWSIIPKAIWPTPPSFSGHLAGLSDLHPNLRLLVVPYLTAAYPTNLGQHRLRNFLYNDSRFAFYAGLYGQLNPTSWLKIDFSVNPDFSQVTPDEARANLDRFELLYPEVRDFFAADAPLFQIGTNNFKVFLSRRIGLAQGIFATEIPIIAGLKAVTRTEYVEAGVMNVLTSEQTSDKVGFGLGDNFTVARVSGLFGESRRLGAFFLNRAGDGQPSAYRAYGVDGLFSLVDEHFLLSGFLARSETYSAPSVIYGAAPGYSGMAALEWRSAEFGGRGQVLLIDRNWDPQMGYVQDREIVETTVNARFQPQVNNDRLRDITFLGEILFRTRLDASRVRERQTLSASALLDDWGRFEVSYWHQVDNITIPFNLADNRIAVLPGTYETNVVSASYQSAPRTLLELRLGSTEGGLWGGYQRVPSVNLGVNLGRLNFRSTYEMFWLSPPGQSAIVEHRVSGRIFLEPVRRLRSVLVVELNSLDPRAKVQWITTWKFSLAGELSLNLTSEVINPRDFIRRFRPTAIFSFRYGFSPF